MSAVASLIFGEFPFQLINVLNASISGGRDLLEFSDCRDFRRKSQAGSGYVHIPLPGSSQSRHTALPWYPIVMGAIRPVSILVGMHHAMTPIALENFATLGYDQLMPMMFIANLSIVGAAAACYFKAGDQQEKQIVGSSVISGILGITEPALFGVLTKYKKAFVAATIGSTVGSAFIGTFGVRLFGYITSSVFSIPAYIGPWFGYAAIGWIMAFGVSFALSYVFVVKMDTGKKEPAADVAVPAKTAEGGFSAEIGAPAKGIVVPMKEIKDDVFSGGVLGACIGVEPAEGKIVAPADGKIVQVAGYPSCHRDPGGAHGDHHPCGD